MRTKLVWQAAALAGLAYFHPLRMGAQELSFVGDSGAQAPGLWRIAYGHGLFVAAGGTFHQPPSGATATSPDGLYWSGQSPIGNAIVGRVWALTAAGSNFVIVGNRASYFSDPEGTNGFIQLSRDGVVWGQPIITASTPLTAVAYGHGTYVAAGQSGATAAIVISRDGFHWETRTFPGYGGLNSMTVGAGTFVAVGDSGTILTSSDGSNWLAQRVGAAGAGLEYVGYGDGVFLAGQGEPWSLVTSTNGTNWVLTSRSLPGAFVYGNGLFLTFGGGISASTNGLDWVLIQTFHESSGAVAAAYGGGTFAVLFAAEGYRDVLAYRPRNSLVWSGKTNGAVDLTLTGGWLGQQGELQATTDLSTTNWIDLYTFTNQGAATPLQDPYASNYTRRFYRAFP